MQNILAVYVRENTIPHYCRNAWVRVGHIIKIECIFLDYSEERKEQSESDIISYRYNYKTGEKIELSVEDLFPDLYVVRTTNARGGTKCYSYKTKDEANLAFVNIKSQFTGWERIK